MPKYLSTDPNEGYLSTDPQEGQATKYLSTDPNEGAEEAPSLFGRSMDVLGRAGNVLSRLTGGTAVAAGINAYQKDQPVLKGIVDAYTPTGIGTFKSNPMGDDIMANAGMDPGIKRALLGLAFDIGTDPGNLLGGSALRVLGKGDDIARGLDKITDVTPGVKNVKNVLENTFTMRPNTKNIMSTAGDPIEFNDLARLYDSAGRSTFEAAQAKAEDVFRKPGSSHFLQSYEPLAERQAISHAIDTKNVAALKPESQKLAKEFMDQMDYLHNEQVALGNLEPQQKLQNYVQYLTKSGRDVEAVVAPNVSSIPQSARTRQQFHTLREAVDHGGATDDAMEIYARSTAQVERAKTRVEFLEQVAKRFNDPNGRAVRMQHLNVSDKVKKIFDGVKLDDRVATDLEKSIKLWDTPTEMDKLIVTANKLFKGAVTAPMPSHHFNNYLGNLHNMYVAGDMSFPELVSTMVKSHKIMVKATDAEKASAIGKLGKYTGDEILNAAKKFEVIGTSAHLGELSAEGTAKILNNKFLAVPRKLGTEMVEEPARFALFMSRIKKGDTLEQAALNVKNVLFDYAELTKGEKAIRDYGFIPFYTWMRKNIPLQIGAAIRHPEKVEAMTNLMNVPWNAAQKDDTAVIPEEFQDSGYVPMDIPAEGDFPVMARWALPMYDVNKLGSPGAFLKDSIGPLVKMPLEAVTGTKMNRAPIHTPTGLARPSGLANVLSPLNYVLPDELQGYVTPTDAGGRPMQHDTLSWLTGQIPTGPLGSTMQGNDPLNPQISSNVRELAMRILGLTPNVITPNDQKYEAIRRKADFKRDQARKIILEQ